MWLAHGQVTASATTCSMNGSKSVGSARSGRPAITYANLPPVVRQEGHGMSLGHIISMNPGHWRFGHLRLSLAACFRRPTARRCKRCGPGDRIEQDDSFRVHCANQPVARVLQGSVCGWAGQWTDQYRVASVRSCEQSTYSQRGWDRLR